MLRRSLNLGLNALDPDAYGGFLGWLVGCENDATALAALAASRGYEAGATFTHRATVADFRAALTAAAADLTAGDKLFVSFSGHGGQIPCLTEWDGYNETLCFYDGQLVDNELRALLEQFAPGVEILLVIDACHSGGMDRALDSVRRPRVLPSQIRGRLAGLSPQTHTQRGEVRAGVAILTACAESETASDGNSFGEFTGALLATSYEAATVKSWYAAAASICRGQTPQLKLIGADLANAVALA